MKNKKNVNFIHFVDIEFNRFISEHFNIFMQIIIVWKVYIFENCKQILNCQLMIEFKLIRKYLFHGFEYLLFSGYTGKAFQ